MYTYGNNLPVSCMAIPSLIAKLCITLEYSALLWGDSKDILSILSILQNEQYSTEIRNDILKLGT